MDAQGRSNGSLDSMGPIQTPISTALGLMQKMEGVARLLGGVLPCGPALLGDWKSLRGASLQLISSNCLPKECSWEFTSLCMGLGRLTSTMHKMDRWHCMQMLQWYE